MVSRRPRLSPPSYSALSHLWARTRANDLLNDQSFRIHRQNRYPGLWREQGEVHRTSDPGALRDSIWTRACRGLQAEQELQVQQGTEALAGERASVAVIARRAGPALGDGWIPPA
jgi:hypothetical protein